MSSDIPTFFFSHTRQDREMRGNYLEKFFEDLVAKVAQYAAVDLKVERIGTIDKQVLQGADWDQYLSEPLSRNRAFIAIMTPFYFKRENCGKELFGFVLRSKNLGIDTNGALTNVENVLPIRWMEEEAYYSNTTKESKIPAILRRVNDTPEDPGGDNDRSEAIKRYRKKGMEWCVTVEPHYTELLRLFALRIRDLLTLDPASGISFATLPDAFTYDWRQHFAQKGALASHAAASLPETVMPRPLESVVAFYITNHQFEIEPTQVHFADQLVCEPQTDAEAVAGAVFSAVLGDVRAAALAEGFTVFHAAANPRVPVVSTVLIDQLAALSESRILPALVIDSAIWPSAPSVTPASAVIEEIVRSTRWIGPVGLVSAPGIAINVDKLTQDHNLPPRLVVLPPSSEMRVANLRQAFVDTRGRLMTMSTAEAPGSEHLPLLQGVRAENRHVG